MRPDTVVVVRQERQLAPCVVQAVKQLLVQEFIAQAFVEVLDERALLGLAAVEVMPLDVVLVGPF